MKPGDVSKWANFAPAGSRKPICGDVWLTPIGVFTSGTIALQPGGFGPGDDAGQRIAVIPVVELEPERQLGRSGRDVLDARRGVDRDHEQAAGPGGTAGHRQFAIRVNRPLKTHRTDDDRRGRSSRRARSFLSQTLETSTRTLGRSRRRRKAASLSPSKPGPGTGADPLVGRRVEDVPGDNAEGSWIQSSEKWVGHRASRKQRMWDLAGAFDLWATREIVDNLGPAPERVKPEEALAGRGLGIVEQCRI